MNRKQFFVTAPLNTVNYITIETYHPDDGVHRYVAGQQFDKEFLLESDAPRNGGETVTFEASSLRADELEQGEEGEAQLEVQLGRIGKMIKERMKHVDLWFPIEIIRRTYTNQSEQPQQIIRMECDAVALDDAIAALSASQVNSRGRDVSRLYNDDFEGLQVFI
ncbi:minor tail protein [Idiomarinaceae phage Phi1M2-2]|uniref:minor tail protein n=1 Tax=Idiomarinaceae phage Phi1M2-2 TaxID=1527515 RepID=UPI0004F64D11|nr:minor tail protein [Idiomarinaceae phage Phi1M2-2]AIM40786.1 hypothetical protein M22_029 [Idiomarinaceae phage Phi1M2-2]